VEEPDETAGALLCLAVARACGKLLRQGGLARGYYCCGERARPPAAPGHAVRAVGWKRRGRLRGMGRDPTRIQLGWVGPKEGRYLGRAE